VADEGIPQTLPYNSPKRNLDTDKKFTGQRLDQTGLYFYNARYYDATIGRFISPDTMIPNPANPQSLNRYSYCLNNPLRYNDPSGHGNPPSLVEKARAAAAIYGIKVLKVGAAAAAKSGNTNMLLAINAAIPIVIGAFCDVSDPSNKESEPELNELSYITGAAAGTLLLDAIDKFLYDMGPQEPTAVAAFLLDPRLTYQPGNKVQFTMGVQMAQKGPGTFSYRVEASIDGKYWSLMNKGSATPTLSGPSITTPDVPIYTVPSANTQYSITLSTTTSLSELTNSMIRVDVNYKGILCNWCPAIIVDFKSGTVTKQQ
jgi:RHS repeat-associated protein